MAIIKNKRLKNKKRVSKIASVLLGLMIIGVIIIFICDRKIKNAGEGKLYSDIRQLPFNKTGLLLGTGKYLPNGSLNPYYRYRLEAAILLMKTGKINKLILSGDNSRKEYNEPETMRSDLIAAGVDSTTLFSDYAGFRTFDSVVRSKEIFGQEAITIISQQFHNERAVYIAGREHINAIGFNAKDLSQRAGIRVQFREKLARVKVFFDYFFNKEPKFLGEKVIIS